MEKASESAKVAARQIISDYGILDLNRVKNFYKNEIPFTEQSMENGFYTATPLVQVEGLPSLSETIPYSKPNAWEKLQIAYIMAKRLHYPGLYVYYVIFNILIFVIIAIIMFFVTKFIYKKWKEKRRG